MQDNDPKHTSRLAKAHMEEQNANWWKTQQAVLTSTQ